MTKPFSERLANASSLSEVFSLSEEIKNLLLNMMKTDKRSLKQELQKTIFKAKLNLYCELYKKTRVKFLEVQQKEGSSIHFKVPLEFEKLMRDFNWQKTVTYSIPVRRDDEDIDTMVDDLYDKDLDREDYYNKDSNISIIDKKKKMKPLFNRNEQEVIDSALELDLVDFLEKYKETSADEKVLKTTYHDIRAKKAGVAPDDAVVARVGNEASTDTLDAVSPTTGTIKSVNPDYPVGAEVEFKFATGEILIGKITESKKVGKITVEVPATKSGTRSTSYPITIDSVTEIISLPEVKEVKKAAVPKAEKSAEKKQEAAPKVEKPKIPAAPKKEKVVTPEGAPVFKDLDKQKKLDLIQELYDSGLKTTGEIKKKLSETYTINHYDDVYNVFIKIKK